MVQITNCLRKSYNFSQDTCFLFSFPFFFFFLSKCVFYLRILLSSHPTQNADGPGTLLACTLYKCKQNYIIPYVEQ